MHLLVVEYFYFIVLVFKGSEYFSTVVSGLFATAPQCDSLQTVYRALTPPAGDWSLSDVINDPENETACF